MPRPVITLLTDFGLRDHYVAAMKGVILGICPEACLVDISHEIEPFHIQQAAWTLTQAAKYFPPGTVHLVVVDPGVGSSRRAIAARSGGHFLVGPDNGVLAQVLDADPGRDVFEITDARYFRHPVSATFHGRDIFAPVAAHLAAGLDISRVGERVPDYVGLVTGKPILREPGCWAGTVVSIDRFGNIVTNLDAESFGWIGEKPFELHIGSAIITEYARNYSEIGGEGYFVIEGSAGFLEVSLNRGDAAQCLSARPGMTAKLKSFS